jgi:hypothetical protein
MTDFNSLSLLEQTQKINALKQHFTAIGRPNISIDDVLELSRAGYDSGSSDLQMFQAGLVDIETLVNAKQPKSTTPKPESLTGTLTEATRLFQEQARLDEAKRQRAIQESNRIPEATAQPQYRQY